MRKIISKREEKKKSKRNQLIGGMIMITIMFFSVVGYSFMGRNGNNPESEESITYNGIEFVKENGLWTTVLGDYKFLFKYNPNEVEKINSNLNLLNNYLGKPLYFSSNGAETEILKNLFYQNQIAQRVQYACLEGEECITDYPVKNCQDNFMIIRESANTEIKQQENCLFIYGKKEDLIKLTDSVLFKIIGIQ